MAVVAGTREQAGLRPLSEREYELRAEARREPEQDDDESPLTPQEQEQYDILKFCARLYEDARKAREPYETFDICWDLFIGNMWPKGWPRWRAQITINKIRAFITFMQAVMTDNKPRISVEPLVPGSEEASDLLRKLVDRDWDENDMQDKLSLFVLYGLIWGTGFMKITYDPYAEGGRGKHCATPVVPYKMYFNSSATSIEDAEYLIHVEDQTMGWVRRNFPDKAKMVARVQGAHVGDRRERDRDFIREGDRNETGRIVSAQNVNGNITAPMYANPNPLYSDDHCDTVEIQEFWVRDDSIVGYERQKYEGGKPKFEPVVLPDGSYDMQVVGHRQAMSEIDGQPFMAPIRQPKMKPVMETAWRAKFPNGRLILIAGGRVLLRDIPNPFQTDGFPYAMWKDYDVGTFLGQGEPIALKDCQLASSRIVSQLYEILEKVGNPSYKLKKGGGVNAASIKNKPGLIIPMDEMDSLAPLDKPSIPREFFELFAIVQKAMGEICGVNDAVMGGLPAANTAFATMDQLQESGAAPIRLKVRNLERGIARIGKLRLQLIQQWDNGARPIRVATDVSSDKIVEPASNVNVQFRSYSKADLQGQVEFGVVPISSLSTSPAGTWNRWMDLYQKHLIDRRWWHQKFRIEGWRTNLPRIEMQDKKNAEQDAALKAASKAKPGPAPSKPARRAQPRPAGGSHIPSRADNAHIR